MYRVHLNFSARSLWVMALPVAASAIRGVIQPIVKFGFEWWPNPIAAVVVSYTVSSASISRLINRARTRARLIGFPREGRKSQRRRRDKRADRPFAKIKELFTKIMRLS